MNFIEFIFWLTAIVLFLIYFGYPLILNLVAQIVKAKDKKRIPSDDYPSITQLVSVFNEENVIHAKIENCLALDYPPDKYKIVVVSDGSTDQTEEIASAFSNEGVEIFRVEGRKGKTNALNSVIPELDTELIVFSDANSMYTPDALKKLVAPFKDSKVGGVCGELAYKAGQNQLNEDNTSEGLYWKYEKWIKRSESKLSQVIVFNGSIYAMRKELHKPMNIGAANDFQHPVQILLQGYKNIYEPEAIAFEEEKSDDRTEFKRHVRITLRGWKGLFSHINILNPFKVGFTAVHFLLRKVLRWLSPLLLILLIVTNIILLNIPFYLVIFIFHLLFYILALIGFYYSHKGIKTIFNPFYYFCLTNYALLVALIKLIFKAESATWTPTSQLK